MNLIDRVKARMHKNVFEKWFFLYMIVLIIVVLLVEAVGTLYVNLFKTTVMESKTEELGIFRERTDSVIDEGRLSALKIANNDIIRVIGDKNFDVWNNSIRVQESVKSLKKQMSTIDDFYIYLKDKELIVSAIGYMNTPEKFFESYYSDTDTDYEQWYNEVLNTSTTRYAALNRKTGKIKLDSAVSYSLPLNYTSGVNATLVTVIDSSRYANTLEHLKIYDGLCAMIYDDTHKTVYSYGECFPKIKQRSEDDGDRFYETRFEGKKYVVCSQKSKVTNWWYVVAIPQKSFLGRIQTVRYGNFLVVLLLLAVGSISVFVITRYNYKALSQVVDRIKEKIPAIEDKNVRDEYELIHRVIDDSTRLYSDVEKNKKDYRQNLISSVLLGVANKNVKAGLYQELDNVFASDRFVVIVFDSNVYGNLFEGEKISEENKFSSMLFIINNILSELLEPFGSIDFAEYGNFVFLFSPKKELVDDVEQIAVREVTKTVKLIEEHFKLHIECAVSSVCVNYQSICVAYKDALTALKQKKNICEANVYRPVDYANKNSNLYYTEEQENNLIQLIHNADYDSAVNQIEWIYEVNEKKNNSDNMMRALLFSLSKTILDSALQCGYVVDGDSVTQMVYENDISAVKSELCSLVYNICRFVLAEGREDDKIWIDTVDKLIEDNYLDVNFTVYRLALLLDLNPDYLSHIYKQKTNLNILSVIQKKRIEKAVEYLVKTDDSVEKISAYTGFGSVSTFNRVFKKHMAVSPGKYRELHSLMKN